MPNDMGRFSFFSQLLAAVGAAAVFRLQRFAIRLGGGDTPGIAAVLRTGTDGGGGAVIQHGVTRHRVRQTQQRQDQRHADVHAVVHLVEVGGAGVAVHIEVNTTRDSA